MKRANTALKRMSVAASVIVVLAGFLLWKRIKVGLEDMLYSSINEGGSPLTDAASSGNVQLLAQQLADGRDVNQRDEHGDSPIFWASRCGKVQAVQFLIDNKADIKGEQGDRALLQATLFGHPEVVKLLDRYRVGDNPAPGNHCARDWTIYRVASIAFTRTAGEQRGNFENPEGTEECVRLLINDGCDPNLTWGPQDYPILAMAALSSNRAMVKDLLAAGADPDRPNKYGKSTLDILSSQNSDPQLKELITLIRQSARHREP